MSYIKLVIVSISKQKKRLALILIQLFFGFSAILIGLNGLLNSYNYKDKIKMLAPLNTLHVCYNEGLVNDVDLAIMEKLYERISKNNMIKNIGIFNTTYIIPNEKSIGNIIINNPIVYKNNNAKEKNDTYMKKPKMFNVVNANNGLLRMANFKLSAGSVTELLNYNMNSEYLPILIGKELSKENPIGSYRQLPFDKYTQNNKDRITEIKKVKVVGILDRDMGFWQGGGTYITDSLVKSDDVIITPFSYVSNSQAYASNILISLKNNVDRAEFIKFVNKEYHNSGISVNVLDIETEFQSYYEKSKVFIYSTICFAILIFLLSSFGLVGVILASIVRRKYEFGIRYAIGSTPNGLAILIAGEISVVYILSNILGILFVKTISGLFLTDTLIKMNNSSIIFSFALTIVLFSIVIILPLVRILRTEPITLISGRSE